LGTSQGIALGLCAGALTRDPRDVARVIPTTPIATRRVRDLGREDVVQLLDALPAHA